MARWLPLYVKKRGHRRTGSALAGRAGEAAFFGGLLIGGTLGFVGLVWWWILPNWRANYGFVPAECVVVDRQLEKRPDADEYRPTIQIRYEVNGRRYVTWTFDTSREYSPDRKAQEALLEQFALGERHECWHSPVDPEQVVLVRGTRWWLWLWLLVPGTIFAVGAAGLTWSLLHWRTSAERRMALMQRAAAFDPFDESEGALLRLPAVPSAEPMKNSPGTRLPFRLPVSAVAGWRTCGAAVVSVLCLIVLATVLILAVRRHLAGEPDWWLNAFALAALGAAAWSTTRLLQRLVTTTGMGPVFVEVSAHPLHPGESYELLVVQAGRLQIKRLEVWLTCHEQATYRQGTDVRVERQLVYQEQLACAIGVAIDSHCPLEKRCRLQVPAAAMHSFQAENNAVQWNVVVRGEAEGWPAFEREFPMVVHPPRVSVARMESTDTVELGLTV